jgi:hypothetical protein
MNRHSLILLILLLNVFNTSGQAKWYTQGSFTPVKRLEIRLKNTLNIDRKDVPIAINRSQFSFSDFQDFDVTIVDPVLEPRPEPSKERLFAAGYHEVRAEANGRMIFHQLDDLDQDGLWDELFFITDMKPLETKSLYLYIGYNDRGWNPHTTAVNIGSYARHIMPFWESEYVGWKLWYPTDLDVYGKRVPQLMSHKLNEENTDGYSVPFDMGSDIMGVASSLGGGGIVLFEDPADPGKVSRPRFTPARRKAGITGPYNAGQISDTRYAYILLVNGPLRSSVKIKTFNWDTGNGFYKLEQIYTAYTRQNYTTCQVKFTTFKPNQPDVYFGAGIKKHPNQSEYYQKDNIVVTGGSEEIQNPDDIDGIKKLKVDYVSTACIVKSKYNPQFQLVDFEKTSNYTFRIKPTKDLSYEYMVAASWSEGGPFKTNAAFREYVIKTAQEYENPLKADIGKIEVKQ